MTTYFLIFGMLFSLLGLYFSYTCLKRAYKKYDQRETLKEDIEKQKYLIKGAMSYLRNRYDTDFDSTPYKNIKIKVDFLKPIIEKRPLEKKYYYYKKLYERLYETTYRLIQNNSVVEIIQPLNSLTKEIVEEQLDYIRENTDAF